MEGDRGRSPVQNPDRRLAKNILGVIPSTPPKGASGGSRARQSVETTEQHCRVLSELGHLVNEIRTLGPLRRCAG
jgi:hypothetical protein